MDYFKMLSAAMGGGMMLIGCWVGFKPGLWKNLAARVMTEKRPRWILWVNAAWTLLVLFTWGMFFKAMSSFSFVVTFVITLSLLKVLGSVFFWMKYREIALALVEEPVAIRAVMFSTAAIGLALLFLGLFF